jgi:hypothetical protein
MIISLGVIATPVGILSMAGALAFTIAAASGFVWLRWHPNRPWAPQKRQAERDPAGLRLRRG